MVLYLPVKEQLHQDELGDYISYGIAAWKLPALTRKPCAFVSDVTLDKKQAAACPGGAQSVSWTPGS